MKRNDINFVEIYKSLGKEKRESNTPAKIYLAVLLVTLLIMGGLWIKLMLDQRVLNNQVAELESYINDSARVARMSEINKMREDVADLNEMETQLHSLNEVMDVIPRYNRQVINVLHLNKPNGIDIKSVEYDGNLVSANVTASSFADVSNYVLELRRGNFFEEVSYTGYSAADGVYEAVVNVALRGNGVSIDE